MAVEPIEDIIDLAEISAYLAEADQAKQRVFKGNVAIPFHPLLLNMESEILDFMNGFNPSNANLDAVANYVYSLCGKYLNEAKVILDAGESGGIVNPGEGTFVVGSKLLAEWTVGTDGYPGVGDTTYSNDALTGVPANRVLVFRNTFTQFHSDQSDGDTFITKNIDDDFFTFNVALSDQEKIQVWLLSVFVEDTEPIPPSEGSESFTGDVTP